MLSICSCNKVQKNALPIGAKNSILLLDGERKIDRSKNFVKYYELKFNNDTSIQLPLLYILVDKNNDTTYVGLDINGNSSDELHKIINIDYFKSIDTNVNTKDGTMYYTLWRGSKAERVIYNSSNCIVFFKTNKEFENKDLNNKINLWLDRIITN